MGQTVSVDGMADAIMEGLKEYADMATSDMKKAVRKSAKTVKDEISTNAPKRTGAYSKSWAAKKTAEATKKTAKRGGGRVAARVHIAPAEQKGIEQLEREIERSLGHG